MKRGTRTRKDGSAAPEEANEEQRAGSEEESEKTSAASAEESPQGRSGIRRVIPWGRRKHEHGEVRRAEGPGEEEGKEPAPDVKERARKGLSRLRERAPSGEEVRGWAEQHLGSQATAIGLGALALGFGVAVLLPPTRVEKKALGTALGAAQQLTEGIDSAARKASSLGTTEEAPPSPS